MGNLESHKKKVRRFPLGYFDGSQSQGPLNITFDLQVIGSSINVVGDENNLEVADTVDDYIIVEAIDVNGIAEVGGGECVLEGLDTDAVEDNVHVTPRIKRRDYKWK